jgi:hypothetical protein
MSILGMRVLTSEQMAGHEELGFVHSQSLRIAHLAANSCCFQLEAIFDVMDGMPR